MSLLEFEDGTKRMEQYIKAMKREITKRRQVDISYSLVVIFTLLYFQVIQLLGQGKKYYDILFGEADIVANDYSIFVNRVKKVEMKLAEKMPALVAQAQGGVEENPVASSDI